MNQTNLTAVTLEQHTDAPGIEDAPITALGGEPLDLLLMQMGEMSVQIAMIDDEPWFYAPSLARVLEYKDARDMTRGVRNRHKGSARVRSLGGVQHATLLTEAGFYRVVFRSQSKVAEPFQDWVCGEVLPSLRKTGQYQLIQDVDQLGQSLNYMADQWDWLKIKPQFVPLIPLALAGYNGGEISRMLQTSSKAAASTVLVGERIRKLKSLGFLPKVIEPRRKQLEQRIKAKLAIAATPTN